MDRPRKFFKRARQQETEFGSPSEFRGGMDLSTVPMHQIADRADRLLEHTVRGGLGDHQRRQPVGITAGFGLEVGQVNVAQSVAGARDNLQSGQVR